VTNLYNANMKWNEKSVAVLVGSGSLALFTALLIAGRIGGGSYAVIVPFAMALSLAISVMPRLQELTLKVGEAKIILAKIEETKAEIEQMYGGIGHLKQAPLVMNDAVRAELGLYDRGFIDVGSLMNYVMGCMKRERARLAQIFVTDKSPERLAEALIDPAKDVAVFKWSSPRLLLDDPPPTRPEPPANPSRVTQTTKGTDA
jgi:hypothetical protein